MTLIQILSKLMFLIYVLFTQFLNASANDFVNLSSWIKEQRAVYQKSSFNYDDCYKISQEYQKMFNIDFDKLNLEEIRNKFSGIEISHQAFLARLDLRNKLRIWETETTFDKVSASCISSIRDMLRVYRYLEETVATISYNPPAFNSNNQRPYLDGVEPYLQKNPKYEKLNFPQDLRSGDLLISRGNAPTSALIARLGDTDGQFSHMAMVYIDDSNPDRKKTYVMEEHIEVGSTVRPYEEYANDHNFRVTVYRYIGKDLAKAAAKRMFFRLSDPVIKHTVPYDFKMLANETSEMFCSEIGYQAFKEASRGSILLGKYKTQFNEKNKSLLNALGVKTNFMFAPSDMEVEPNFELLAEFKDLSRVYENHRMDAILTQFLYWGAEYGYILKPNIIVNLKSSLSHVLRSAGFLEKKLPTNMPVNAIRVVMQLNDVVESLNNILKSKFDKHLLDYGLPLTFKQMYQILEEIRLEDFEKFKKNEKTIFHHIYSN